MTGTTLDGGGGVEGGRDPAEASTPPRPPAYPTINEARAMFGLPQLPPPSRARIYPKVMAILNDQWDEAA